MIFYGLIGYPLAHSGSRAFFAEKFQKEGKQGYEYQEFPLPSLNDFPPLFKQYPCLKGLNVTNPYKVSIIPWLEGIDAKAEKIGAVNTILVYREKGNVHLNGFNTDSDGFQKSSDFSGHTHALILGTGGASKAVAFALKEMGISYLFVSRNKKCLNEVLYDELTEKVFSNHTLIINATPLGMFPDNESTPPISYQYLTEKHFLYDLVYFPPRTTFLKKGEAMGARVQNGRKMLEIQAELSYRIWNK